jgi:hypothetical protein
LVGVIGVKDLGQNGRGFSRAIGFTVVTDGVEACHFERFEELVPHFPGFSSIKVVSGRFQFEIPSDGLEVPFRSTISCIGSLRT